jgi:hypothetical protein
MCRVLIPLRFTGVMMFDGVPIAVHFGMVHDSGKSGLGLVRNYTKCLDGCVATTLEELKEDCRKRQAAAQAAGTPYTRPRTDC